MHFQFVPDAERFDLINAYQLAGAAEIAYSSPDMIEYETQELWGLRDFEFIKDRGTECFVTADADIVLVAFRGTQADQLSDWLTDLNVELVKGPMDGRVHAGFYTALSDVWQVLDQVVRRFDRRKTKSLWITGHSLGAALASLAAARWTEQGRVVHGCYTFGQPRTGDNDFARNFNFALKHSSYRFVNNNDLVTRIPPRSFGFSHLGSFKYFTDDGNLKHEIDWWNLFLDRWQVRIQQIFKQGEIGLLDHSMTSYRQLVGQALEKDHSRYSMRRNLELFLSNSRTQPSARSTSRIRRRAA